MALADLELSCEEDAATLAPYISPSHSNNIMLLQTEQVEEISEEKSSSS